MRKISRKSKVIICLTSIMVLSLIISAIVHYNLTKDDTEKYTIEDPGDSYIPLYETGLGEGSEEDCYMIEASEYSAFTCAFPGRCYVRTEKKGQGLHMSKYIGGDWARRDRLDLEYYYAVFYDFITGEEIGRIDLGEIIEKDCPGYQLTWMNYMPSVYGKDGGYYLEIDLENIPRKATDETIEKQLLVNIDTEETIVRDYIDVAGGFAWSRYYKEDKEYSRDFNNADWKSFKEANNYGVKQSQDRLSVLIGREGKGCVNIEIPCEGLPQKNDLLYERFPGLKKWVGDKDKKARIYIGGYPTAEEVMAMFERSEVKE